MSQEDKVHGIDDPTNALVKDVTVAMPDEQQKVDETLLVSNSVGGTVAVSVASTIAPGIAPAVGPSVVTAVAPMGPPVGMTSSIVVPAGVSVAMGATGAVTVSAPMSSVTVAPPGTPVAGNVGHIVTPVEVKVEDLGVDGLIEVREAMKEANEVFNRVKSEKIAEQALCSIRNDQQQYEGLAKEIVGKAIKQKERERANRASAAASRAKVMRYQTELESRLNRVEAERNAYRKELHDLKHSSLMDKSEKQELTKQFQKLHGWIQKMEGSNPEFVRSIIAQDEMEGVFGGDKRKMLDTDGMDGVEDTEESEAKKRRI